MQEDLVFREDVFEEAEPWAGPEGGDGLYRRSPGEVAPATVAGIVAALLAGLDGGAAVPERGGHSAGLWKRAGLLDLMAQWR